MSFKRGERVKRERNLKLPYLRIYILVALKKITKQKKMFCLDLISKVELHSYWDRLFGKPEEFMIKWSWTVPKLKRGERNTNIVLFLCGIYFRSYF